MITRVRRFCQSLIKPGGFPAFILALLVKCGIYRGIKVDRSDRLRYIDLKTLDAIEPDYGEIPKLIFQTWKTRDNIPSTFYHWSTTIIEQNPDYLHFVWDDDDNRRFIASHFAWFLNIYDSFPAEIYRADVVRPFFLFYFGGVYADMDIEGLRPMKLPSAADIVVGRMGFDKSFKHSIPNAIIASKPRQLFWLLVISITIEEFHKSNGVMSVPEDITGSVALKTAVDLYSSSSNEEIMERAAHVLANLPPSISETVSAGVLVERDPLVWYPLDWHDPIQKRLRSVVRKKNVLVGPIVSRLLFRSAEFNTFWTHYW